VRSAIAAAIVTVSLSGGVATLAWPQSPAPGAPPQTAAALPSTVSLFPLPDVVLFPDISLPLRIFEPRYRAMVADALKGNRIIGMVLLRPGYEADYEGRPPIFPVGCAGVITQVEQLANGEYTLVLRGLQKFEVTREESGGAYRVAHITPIVERPLDEPQIAAIRAERQRVETLLARLGIAPAPASLSEAGLVIGLAQILELTPIEWQELLERDGVLARLRSLADRLETLTLPGGNLAQRWPPGSSYLGAPVVPSDAAPRKKFRPSANFTVVPLAVGVPFLAR
jgi:Lon protease-like protein